MLQFVLIDILMEVTKAREYISPEPDLNRPESSSKSMTRENHPDVSEGGSDVFKENNLSKVWRQLWCSAQILRTGTFLPDMLFTWRSRSSRLSFQLRVVADQ